MSPNQEHYAIACRSQGVKKHWHMKFEILNDFFPTIKGAHEELNENNNNNLMPEWRVIDMESLDLCNSMLSTHTA